MSGRFRGFALLAFGAALVVLVSPLKQLWARSSLTFLAPFILWLALIVLGGWLSRPRGRDDL